MIEIYFLEINLQVQLSHGRVFSRVQGRVHVFAVPAVPWRYFSEQRHRLAE